MTQIATNYIIDYEFDSFKTKCPIQVGILVCDDKLNVMREFESLIKLPKKSQWDEKAEAVHGIPKSKLKDAPTQEEVGLMITGLFKLYASEIHHNQICWHAQSKLDWEILMDLLMGADCISGLPSKIVPYNTLKEARKLKLFESYALTSIMEKLDYTYDAHRAIADCYATRRLMQEIQSYE